MTEEGFVTVAEASQILTVNERSARRAAGHLSDTDRQMSDKRRTLVRLSALAVQMGKSWPPDSQATSVGQAPDISEQAPDTSAGMSDKAPDTAGQPESALVEQLRGEVEYLRSALVASQQIASQAQQLQLLAERRVGELEGKLLPAREIAGGSQSESEGQSGVIPVPDTEKRPWWVLPAFWKGKA